MLHGKNVVVVSTISWDFLWQGHQAISTILASEGNRVLFIENTGVRPPGWGDRRRIVERLRSWMSGRGRFGSVRPNVVLYSPLALPFPYSPLAQRLNRRWICGGVRRWLRAHAFDDPVLLTFLPSQFTLDLMDEIDPAVAVFCCNDKLSETSPAAARLVPYEQRVLERCDLVVASALKLAEHCRRYNANTRLMPTGVSLAKFDAAWRGDVEMPAELAGLRRPLVGHVGGLRKCVDQELLAAVSERLPDASFVLVGPEQVSVDRLRRRANVHLLGSRPHDRIPAYVRAFDVCLIPYVVDGFTDHISPAKLNEYLALGKPVVSTPLFEVRGFHRLHGDVVSIADGADAFASAVEQALRDDGAAARARRRAVAEMHAWELKTETLSEWIEQAMAGRRSPGSAAGPG